MNLPEDKLHVAVDLDDVVLDFINGVRATFTKEFGGEGIPNYGGTPWGADVVEFTKHPRLLEAGYKSWWGWLRDRDWLWATFPAIDGAIGGIQTLRHEGHYVECVTSKPDWAEHNVWKWFSKWRPAFNRVTIVTNGQSKLDFTEADLIVDDKLATCEEFAANGRMAIFFDRSGGDTPLAPGIYRARDWDEIVDLVRKEAEGDL